MNRAWPPLAVFWNAVMPPLLVITIALPAELLLLNSKMPPLFVMMVAVPAVLVFVKNVVPPLLLVMEAPPAVLVSANSVKLPDPLLVIVALAAVLALTKKVPAGAVGDGSTASRTGVSKLDKAAGPIRGDDGVAGRACVFEKCAPAAGVINGRCIC